MPTKLTNIIAKKNLKNKDLDKIIIDASIISISVTS